MRKMALAGLSVYLVLATPLVTVAQPSDAGGHLGAGGRIEVQAGAYAIALPDDWVHIRPTGTDVDSIMEQVRAVLPDVAPAIEAALNGGMAFSLLAFGPDVNAAFVENCNVLDRPSDGRSIDAIGADELSKLAPLREILALEPELTFVELPSGRAGRLDIDLTLPNFDTASTSYLMTDGIWVHTLTCTDLERPVDAWLGIAQGFEFLPATP